MFSNNSGTLDVSDHVSDEADCLLHLCVCETGPSIKLRAEDDSSWHMAIKTHFGKNGIYDTCLDGVALQVRKKCMVEGVSQGRFIVDLIDQVCIEACHGGVVNSFRHFSHLGLSLFKFERPRTIEVDVKAEVMFWAPVFGA